MMAAMVSVLWAYDGWTNVTPLAEEIRDPGRNVPRALIWGMAVLIAVYLAMTLAYHYVLPMDEIASASSSSKDFRESRRRRLLRPPAGQARVSSAISMLVMCSTFISLNGNALTGPRAYFAMARDGLFPAGLCRVHPRFQTPANAIALARDLGDHLDGRRHVLDRRAARRSRRSLPDLILTALEEAQRDAALRPALQLRHLRGHLFYMLAIASVFVLRVRQPDLPRPYRTWGYPLTPLLYVAAALLLLGNMLADHQSRVQSLAGIGIILLGLPAYWLFRGVPHVSRCLPIGRRLAMRRIHLHIRSWRPRTHHCRLLSQDRPAARVLDDLEQVILLAGPGEVLVLLGDHDEADAHLVGGRFAPFDDLGRLVGVAGIVGRVVVVRHHIEHRSLGQNHGHARIGRRSAS